MEHIFLGYEKQGRKLTENPISKTGNLEKHVNDFYYPIIFRQEQMHMKEQEKKLHPCFSYAYFSIIIDIQWKGRKIKKKKN